MSRGVPVNSATADKSEQEALDPFDFAPHFALNGRASDFAKATPDKSQGKQDRFHGNDRELVCRAHPTFLLTGWGREFIMSGEECVKLKKGIPEDSIVITKEEILKVLAKNEPELQKRFKVSKMALFGSYARGDQQPNSDVDILVEVDPSIGLEFVTLAERIEKLLGVSVDLVSSRAVNSRAMKYIEPELIYV